MRNYVLWQSRKDCPPKASLAMNSMKSIISLGIIPKQLNSYVDLFQFRAYLKTLSNLKIEKNTGYILNNPAKIYFDNILCSVLREGYEYIYDADGKIIILDKPFEKWYKVTIKPLADWVKSDKALETYNAASVIAAANELFGKYCLGTVAHWEMESLSFYYTEHELAQIDLKEYNITNWNDIPSVPVVIGQIKTKNSSWDKYQLYRICGTVLDKDKNKHIITLLTTDGVISVKYYAGAFSHYNKQLSRINEETGKKERIEESWFSRGSMLLITGIRRDDTFFPKKYKDSIYQHTTCKINNVHGGYADIQLERIGTGD